MKIKLGELRQIVKSIIKEERAKRLINEITKVEGWEEVKKRFTDTDGIDFKPLDKYYKGYEYNRSGSTTNYEYVVFLDLDNKNVELALKSDGTFGVVHDDGDKNTPVTEHMKGAWKWDGSKIVFSRNTSKNIRGLFTDADKDIIKAVYTDNKVGAVGAKGPLVKKIQKYLINRQVGYDFDPSKGETEKDKKIFFYEENLVKAVTRDYIGCMTDENKCDGIFGNGVKNMLKKIQEQSGFMQADGVWGKEMTDYAGKIITGNMVNKDWT